MAETRLGPGREFDAIRALVARWGARARGIGDDAAVLDVPDGEQLVVSTDVSVEHVHFRREWLTAGEIGWRATVAAASDLAAMAATPIGILTALTVPPSWRGELPAIGVGIGEAAERVGAAIVGGDLSDGDVLSLAVTVLGCSRRPLRRSGAKPGDALWVTGAFGGPGRAVRDWLALRTPLAEASLRFARPSARIAHARWLAERGATACIDISDGLVADLGHLAAASEVRVEVALDALPCVADVSRLDAAVSGEEYELAVTAPADLDVGAFELAFGIPLTRLGVVTAGDPGVAVTLEGSRVELTGGYDHFSL
jgi:thiamine-monophosphate kinase